MRRNTQPINPARGITILHGVITSGLILITAILALNLRLRGGPALADASMIGHVVAGAGAVLVAVALGVVRPGIPERRRDQEPDVYWNESAIRGRALFTWFLAEAGGVFASLAYLLTGAFTAVAVAVLAILALFWVRPARIEGEGAA